MSGLHDPLGNQQKNDDAAFCFSRELDELAEDVFRADVLRSENEFRAARGLPPRIKHTSRRTDEEIAKHNTCWLDIQKVNYHKKALRYIEELLFACSEYNSNGTSTPSLDQFINDWQKVHGQMTFSSAVLLGVPKWDNKRYIDFRMLEGYMADCWNEYAERFHMMPTTTEDVKIAFELPDAAMKKESNRETAVNTGKSFLEQTFTFKAVVIVAVIAFALGLVAFWFFGNRTGRFQSVKYGDTPFVVDTRTGEVFDIHGRSMTWKKK